jgi:hypothetical protein
VLAEPYGISNMVATSRIVKWKVVITYAFIAWFFSVIFGLSYGLISWNFEKRMGIRSFITSFLYKKCMTQKVELAISLYSGPSPLRFCRAFYKKAPIAFLLNLTPSGQPVKMCLSSKI